MNTTGAECGLRLGREEAESEQEEGRKEETKKTKK